MEMLQIEAKKRDLVGTSATRKLRERGLLPCVLYGHGAETIPLALPEKEVTTFFRQRGKILNLDIEGKGERAIVRDIQYDALGNSIIHLDLLRIRLDEVISVRVRIRAVGVSPGVEAGGIQEILRNEIQVKCVPTKIPDAIEVDVSGMGLQDTLHLRDIALPEGVELDEDPEYTVISIVSKTVAPEPEAEEAEEAGEAGEAGEEAGEGKEGGEGGETQAGGGKKDGAPGGKSS